MLIRPACRTQNNAALFVGAAAPPVFSYVVPFYGQSLSLGATPTELATIVSGEATKTITGATQANPVVLTIVAHGYANNDEIYIASVGGMTQINKRTYRVTSLTADTVSLQHHDGVNVDGTAFGAYTSGGTAARTLVSGTHKMFVGGVRPGYDHRLTVAGNVNNYVKQSTQLASLVGLRERVSPLDTTCGETFAYGMGLHITPECFFYAMGRGAYTALQLQYDSTDGHPHFSNLYAGAKEARNLLVAGGKTVSTTVPMIYKQGESDTATSKADWKTRVQAIRSDAEKGFKHAMLADVTVKMIVDQMSLQNHAQSQGDLAVASIEMHRDVANIFCAGPTYWCSFRANNDVHFTQIMYRRYGEHLGRIVNALIETGDWQPCHITGVSRSGTTITVNVKVPEGALTTDTTNVSSITNSGFTYSGATITGVSITDDGSTDGNGIITITINAAAGGTLSYAYENGTSGQGGPTIGSRGNIRDSSTFVTTYDSTPIYNWLCNDQWVVA
jgi:hypothetical protein